MAIEKRIYPSWAFSENEHEKGRMNEEIYQELMNKYIVYLNSSKYDLEDGEDVNFADYDVVIGRKAEYLKSRYYVYKNACNLSENELALLCDHGNLCFGYRAYGNQSFIVFED